MGNNFACCADDEIYNTAPGANSAISIAKRNRVSDLVVEDMMSTQSVEPLDTVEDAPAVQDDFTTAQGDNMNQFKWDGPEDPDQEISEFAATKSEFEQFAGIKFSKNGIIDFIEKVHSDNNVSQNKNWDKKSEIKDKIIFHLNKGGSDFKQDQPFLHTQAIFNRKFKMDKLVQIIYNREHVMKWDKGLEIYDVEEIEGKKSFGYTYQKQKKQFGIDSRDFYEKSIQFWSNGKFYKWTCALNKSEQKRPVPDKDTVRGETIYNCITMERGPNEQIILSTYTQMDFKMQIPNIMLSNIIPSQIKKWHDSVVKYYTSNNKKIK